MPKLLECLLMMSSILLLQSCQSPDSDLAAANAALSKMVKRPALQRSCFTVVFPDCQVSNFLDYLFSNLGAAEWPIAFDEFKEEQMKLISQVPLPHHAVASSFNGKNLFLAGFYNKAKSRKISR